MSYSQHQAQGTSLAVLMLPVVFLAVRNYYKAGIIDPKVVGIIALPSWSVVYLGSKWALALPAEPVKKVFGVVHARGLHQAHLRQVNHARAKYVRYDEPEAKQDQSIFRNGMIDRIKHQVAQLRPDMVEWRRHLHQHPELSFQEHRTAAYVQAVLSAEGIGTRAGVGKLDTGVSGHRHHRGGAG